MSGPGNYEGEVCDFCSSPVVVRSFGCATFTYQGLPMFGSTGEWAACAACGALVDQEKWDELAERSLQSLARYVQMTPAERAEHKQLIKRVHAQFRQERMRSV